MIVILDELNPIEFFKHGGIVKVSISDEKLLNDCDLKKKNTFFNYKSYIRFFRNIYLKFLHNNSGMNQTEVYEYVNEHIIIQPTIGTSKYTIDLKYDKTISFETAKFYYSGENVESSDINPRDPFGIKNVCFSLISEDDSRWEEFEQQRLETGFDNSELWSLDGTIAKFIAPRLERFYELNKKIESHPFNINFEKWMDILEKMVFGFNLIANDKIKTEEEESIEQEALDLFAKYYFALWI